MDKEKYFDVKGIKGRYQQAVAPDTAKALITFCGQEPEFEQAIEQSEKTFQDCLDSVAKGIKQSCSDFEVYSRAVKFFFSTAEVHFNMTVDLVGKHADPPITMTQTKSESLSLSLDSLLDF